MVLKLVVAAMAFMAGVFAGSAGPQFLGPPIRELTYIANRIWPNVRPDPMTLAEMRHRRIITHKEYVDMMRDNGFSQEQAENFYHVTRRLLSVSEIVEAWRRGALYYEDAISYMVKLGYSESDATLLLAIGTYILTPPQVVDAYQRGLISEEDAIGRLGMYGLSEEDARLFLQMSWKPLPVGDAIAAYRRGIITREELSRHLRANGIPEELEEKLLKVTEYFPTPADIVRFAVREVFNPQVVEKFGLMQDMPEEYLKEAKKAGLSEEFAKWYWAAHWELPSITQAFEMFHRKIISREELELLLRTQDVMPFWRDKLIQLSYILPTRVDLRRMYELGQITEEELKEYYEKLGYSPEDAEKLTQWTKLEYGAADRDEMIRYILELYKADEITREEAAKMLEDLALPKDIIEFKLAKADFEKLEGQTRDAIALLVRNYVEGVISLDELRKQLLALPISLTRVERILSDAVQAKRRAERKPSLADLKRWVKMGIISIQEFVEELRAMNYSEKNIERYLKEVQAGGASEEAG